MSTIRDTPRPPLTARSVIASNLLGVDPPRLPALALVRFGELFGLSEGATRTALSRMTAAGEVIAEDGSYRLTGTLLERHARQQAARTPASRSWDGTWIAAVVMVERRSAADRAAFRTSARRLHLAEAREGLWVRPDDRPADRAPADRAVVESQSTWLRGIVPDEVEPFVAAFDLDGWAGAASSLIAEMSGSQDRLDRNDVDAIAETFVTSAAVLRHLVADPDLPSALLPDDWPGSELRAVYGRFEAAFQATWRAWFREFRDRRDA